MRIVGLTMTIEQGMVTYPGHPVVEITQLARFGYEGKETRKVTLGTHTGTHIDAPRHYVEGGGTVEHIPLDVLCGPASLVDLSFQVWVDGGVPAAELAHAVGAMSVERLLLRFDGEKRLGSMDYYYKQPWLTEETAHWLVDKGCKVLGLDIPMPDAPHRVAEMPIHKILLGAGVV